MKKRVLGILLLTALIVLPYATAGLFDFFKKDKSLAPDADTQVAVTVGGVAPLITSVQQVTRGASPGNVDLLAGTTANVYFNFTASDSNGAGDLNDATATGVFNKSGIRITNTCSNVREVGNTRTYQCTMPMPYYSESGIWNVNVSIKDVSGNYAANLTTTFNVNLLKDISINPASIGFPNVVPGGVNILSSTNTTVTNQGNYVVPTNGPMSIIAYNLTGETNQNERIPAVNFRASGLGTVCTTGTILSHGVSQNINNIALARGASGNTDEIAYCLTSVPTISSQTYSTQGGGSQNWRISI